MQVMNGEAVIIDLRVAGYGYTNAEICLTGEGYKCEFTLAILKPAPDMQTLYGTQKRPYFHYSAPYGYINDPNGMVYSAHTGKYHLFYQAYPYAQRACGPDGNKHWGHAVTEDLVTFQEYPTALYPDDNGSMWSGTAVVDRQNTAGLYGVDVPPEDRLLLVYYARKDIETRAGLAYTSDGGKSWVKADRMLQFIGVHPGHIDPKVFWCKEFQKWVMFCASGELYTSEDLWIWHYNSTDKAYECPDIYPIQVEETREIKYVRTYGGTFYRVGEMVRESDGAIHFVPETEYLTYNGDSLNRDRDNGLLIEYGWNSGKTGTFYATQHYAETPNNRVVSVSWMIERGLDPTENWAGAMSIATQQKLHKKADGSYILCSYPVQELEQLHKEQSCFLKNILVTPDSENILQNCFGTYLDIDCTLCLESGTQEVGFKLRTGDDGGDITIKYDVSKELLIADYSNSQHGIYNGIRSMVMKLPEDREISLRILLDSIIVESFGNMGEASISSVFCREEGCETMAFYTVGGNTHIRHLKINRMGSCMKTT